MKVLIGCEESGVVRDAFIENGHDAVSCDLIACRRGGNHIQGDIMEVIEIGGDLVILHPDCTRMALSGNRWWAGTHERTQSIDWTVRLWKKAKRYFGRAALEQPKSVLGNALGPHQSIQPWHFGHGETKETWLWLYNLPPLVPTSLVCGREDRVWKMAPNAHRKRDRSETFLGIAKAMAQQWGNLENRCEKYSL